MGIHPAMATIQGDGGEQTQLQSLPWQRRLKQKAMPGMTLEVFLSMDGDAGEGPANGAKTTPRMMMMMVDRNTEDEEMVVEKIVERRQKRMMKNRESAARSRARKQAYTNELEIKIALLEEENTRLRKQREMENLISCMPPLPIKSQLRRTSSCPL